MMGTVLGLTLTVQPFSPAPDRSMTTCPTGARVTKPSCSLTTSQVTDAFALPSAAVLEVWKLVPDQVLVPTTRMLDTTVTVPPSRVLVVALTAMMFGLGCVAGAL